ncbi:MAG: DUF2339 domain-containing protein [Candidatus Omnitrophica bacterium]|nr:DUF2339 domain-containing protein [Candidatus Omnitrophota bacterium]
MGIISVVVGVAFFLAYAFKYLAPLWKICIGYVISAAMVIFGAAVEKIGKYKWYGKGLMCGGWVLAYFTTYAMYHIKATRIISSQPVDLILVSIVIVAMLMHLLKYRSQSLVILAMLLGYVTAGVSQYASFAFLYVTILAVISSVLLLKMNWQGVAIFSLLGTYLTHLLWSRPYQLIKPGTIEFWVSITFLAIYWSIYNIVSFFVKAKSAREQNGLEGFILMNSLLFGLICFMQVRAYNSAWKAPFALTVAGILLVLGIASKYTKEKGRIKAAFFVAAIAFATASLHFLIGQGTAYFIWFFEIPILLFAGFYFKNILYRIAAWGITLITLIGMMIFFGIPDQKILFIGKEMHLTFFLYLTGIACYYLARYVYVSKDVLSKREKEEMRFSNVYTILASIVFVCISYYEIQPKLVTLTWAVSAFLLFIVGFFIKDKIFRYCAIGLVAASLLRGITVDLAGINTGYRIIVFMCLGLVLLAVSFWYAKMSDVSQDRSAVEGRGGKLAPIIIMPLISILVLVAAYLYPSEFRAEDKLKGREIEITARFMAGKSLSDDDLIFLRARKFKNLEQALRSLPLGKDGYNLNIYVRAIDMGMESKDMYSRLAQYYSEKDERSKAIENYERGIALDPEIRQWNTRYMVRSAAKLYKAVGNYRNAAAYYEKYLVFYKNVEDLYELAICYERLGELNKALEKLNEALRLDQGGAYSGEITSLRSDIYSKKEMIEKKEASDRVAA